MTTHRSRLPEPQSPAHFEPSLLISGDIPFRAGTIPPWQFLPNTRFLPAGKYSPNPANREQLLQPPRYVHIVVCSESIRPPARCPRRQPVRRRRRSASRTRSTASLAERAVVASSLARRQVHLAHPHRAGSWSALSSSGLHAVPAPKCLARRKFCSAAQSRGLIQMPAVPSHSGRQPRAAGSCCTPAASVPRLRSIRRSAGTPLPRDPHLRLLFRFHKQTRPSVCRIAPRCARAPAVEFH